jgi:hypothetical protein
MAAAQAFDLWVKSRLHNPGGSILGDSWGNTKCFLAQVANRAAPTASRRFFGKEK